MVNENDPWREYKDYDPHAWEKSQGHKRIEVLVPVSALVRWFRKIFKGKRK